MLYEEILDEEEELERKQAKLQRLKQKKGNHTPNSQTDEDYSYDDIDLDEEDLTDPNAISDEEDLDDSRSLKSYQQQPPPPESHQSSVAAFKEFLNESTADFNKEIR